MPEEDTKNSVYQRTEEAIKDPMVIVVESMRSVIIDTPEAEQNATSISDGNGGRVLL